MGRKVPLTLRESARLQSMEDLSKAAYRNLTGSQLWFEDAGNSVRMKGPAREHRKDANL